MSIAVDPAQSNGPVNVLIAGSAPGTPGTPGLPGKSGAGIVQILLSDDGMLTAFLSDGTTVSCSADAFIATAGQLAAQSVAEEFLTVKQQSQTAEGDAAEALQVAKAAMPSGDYGLDPKTGLITMLPEALDLPDGLELNGPIFVTDGSLALPVGLSSNGGIVMTDGTVRYKGSYNNLGVLCASR